MQPLNESPQEFKDRLINEILELQREIDRLSEDNLMLRLSFTLNKFQREFTVEKILGIGGSGVVFQARHKVENLVYAVKRIAIAPGSLDHALLEVRTLAQLDHRRIVRYYSTWIERPDPGMQYEADEKLLQNANLKEQCLSAFKSDCIFIYMQMQLGDSTLTSWMEEHRSVEARNLSRMKAFFRHIVSGVTHLHSKNLIHRDLKPCNILMFDEKQLKICDMGIVVKREYVNGVEVATMHKNAKTPMYMSPEQDSCMPILDSKSDVFTLGLIYAEMCIIMDKKSEIFDNYRRGINNDMLFGFDQETAAFVARLTAKNKNDRPESKEVKYDIYLSA